MKATDMSSDNEFEYISEEADDALEIIFEHPDGITEEQLERFGLLDGAELVDQLSRAGIQVRKMRRGGVTFFLPPLRIR